MMHEQTTDPEPRYAWVIVGVAMAMSMAGFGALANMTVFLKPLAAEFGWLRGELALSYTAITVGAGLGGILMGALSDRLPTRRVVLFGVFFLSSLLFLLSKVEALWQVYFISVLIGFLGFSAMNIPMVNLLGSWFTRNLGFAIGLATAGGAIGQGVIPLVAAHLIGQYGWRSTYNYLGISYLLVLLPLALLVRLPSARDDAASSIAAGSAPLPEFGLPRAKMTALLSFAVIFCCITMATPILHIASLASDLGFHAETAAGALAVMMLAGVVGRVLAGRGADRLGGVQTYAITAFAQTVLVFWFTQMNTLGGLYVMAALFGLGYAGVMTSLIYCARQFAPAGKSGLALGIVTFFGWFGMGLGGFQGGYFYDLTGSYTVSFMNAAISGMLNLVLIAIIYHYAVRNIPHPAAQPA